MKKTVLTFGLISGGISAALMLATVPFIYQIGFDKGTIVGYTSLVLAFLLVFPGIRSYRETVCGGYITFGRALKVGMLITLISSICYIVMWLIVYYNFLPDFVEKYTNYELEKMRAGGSSAQEIAAHAEYLKSLAWIYESPFYIAAVTLIEPLTVGIPVTLISAGILTKRRPSTEEPELNPEGAKLSSSPNLQNVQSQ